MELTVYVQDNCRYCKPVVNFLEDEGVEFIKINLSETPEEQEKNGIMSTPTVILMDDEEEIARTSGYNRDDLEVIIENLE